MKKAQKEKILTRLLNSSANKKRYKALKSIDALSTKNLSYEDFTKNWLDDFLKGDIFKAIKRNKEIFGVVHSVSSSGMSRNASFYIVLKGRICRINWFIHLLLDSSRNKHDEIILKGCGMDMLFNEVYNLASLLFDDGYYLSSERM